MEDNILKVIKLKFLVINQKLSYLRIPDVNFNQFPSSIVFEPLHQY